MKIQIKIRVKPLNNKMSQQIKHKTSNINPSLKSNHMFMLTA